MTWTDNATNEAGFVVERCGAASPTICTNFATLATVGPRNNTDSVSYTDTTVTNPVSGSTIYNYRVKAVNGAGSSGYSNTASVTVTSVAPAAPTNLTATLQAGPQVRLTWTDNATNETAYIVERSVGLNSTAFAQIAALAANSTSYTDILVSQNNVYNYRVKAVNGAVSSAYSLQASVTVPSAPAAPTALTATAARANGNNDTVTLRWTDNSNNETNWTIQRAINAQFTAGPVTSTITSTTGSSTLVTVQTQQTGLPRATTFFYRVQAVNGVITSAWSNTATVTTP